MARLDYACLKGGVFMHGDAEQPMADRVVEENTIVVVGNCVRTPLPADQPAPGDFTASDCAEEVGGAGRDLGRCRR